MARSLKVLLLALLLPSVVLAQPSGNPLPVDAARDSTLSLKVNESTFQTRTGSLTETAPATDTASSGLNGRLQRVAQRLTSLIALFPSALTGSGNFKVALVETTVTQPVAGDVANDTADSGNPVKIGLQARSTNPTPVADGDRVNAIGTTEGVQAFIGNKPRELKVKSGVITLTNTNETTLIAAGAAGIYHDLEWIKCSNTSSTAVRVDIRDATAGTVIDTIEVPGTDVRGAVYGVTPFTQTTAANNWTVQLSASVTDVRCQAGAVKNQ